MTSLIQQTVVNTLNKNKTDIDSQVKRLDDSLTVKVEYLKARAVEILDKCTSFEADVCKITESIQT